jgi:uncharacterized integral membrane protein
MQLYVVLALIFAILITLFAIFNATAIPVNFLVADVEMPLALVIIGSALIGALAMLIFDAFRRLKSVKSTKELKKKIDELNKMIASKDETILKLESSVKQCESTVSNQQDLINAMKNSDSIQSKSENPINETVSE